MSVSVFNVDLKSFTIDQVGPLGTNNLTLATENVITNAITAAIVAPSLILAQRDYGAVGNGIADDTVPLDNAIAAAIAQGKILYLENGTYLITGSLTSSNGLTILGAPDVTIIAGGSFNFINISGLLPYNFKNITFGTSPSSTNYIINTSVTADITFENCNTTRLGYITASASLAKLHFLNCDATVVNQIIDINGADLNTCSMTNCSMTTSSAAAECITANNFSNIYLNNTSITRTGVTAVDIFRAGAIGTGTCTNSIFINSSFTITTGSVASRRIVSAGTVTNVKFEGCTFALTGNFASVTRPTNLSFTSFLNCSFTLSGTSASGVSVSAAMTSCLFESCRSTLGFSFITALTLNDTYITECAVGDITISFAGVDSDNVYILNNNAEFIDCNVSPVNGGTNIFVMGNKCTGIQCELGTNSSDYNFTNNTITSTGNGIEFNTFPTATLTNSMISNNIIVGPGGSTGIFIDGITLCENVQVTNNNLTNFAMGIQFTPDTVTNCYVFGNYADATTPYTLDASLISTGFLEFDATDPRSYSYTTIPAADYSFINVVRDYGAVGDGVADDTIPLNNALTAGVTQGKPVFFPGGTYRTTAVLTVPASVSGFRMLGSSWHNAIIECDYVGNTLNFVGGNGIIVEDITFNPQAATDGGVAITINPVAAGTTPSMDITIRNVHTGTNAVLGAIELIYGVNVTIDNCVFEAGDIQVSGSTNKSSNITITNCVVTNIVLDSLCENVIVNSCKVLSASGIGIECRDDGSTITNLTIVDSLIDGAGNDGISLGDVSDVKISNCTISNCTDAGINFLTGGSQENVIISDNSFITNDKGGINVRNTGSVTITDNKFDGNSVPADTYSGILADSTKTTGSFNVTGNTFVNAHQYSLNFDAAVTRFIIANNDMTGVTGAADTPASSAIKVIMANIG